MHVEFGRTTLEDVSREDKWKRAEMAWTWQYLILLLFFTFILAGLLEELMKYIAVVYVKRRLQKLQALDYVACAIASATGFSTAENIGFVYASAEVDSRRMTMLTVAERVIIAMRELVIPWTKIALTVDEAGHALMGVLTAVNMIHRDLRGLQYSALEIFYPSVLYHGCFDFAMLAVSAVDGNVGWIHPKEPSRILLLLVLAVSMLSTLVWHVRRAIGEVELWSAPRA